jgi:chromosome segregation ATPase
MITEQEMREFFQKMIDTVAQLSTQAQKVEGLEQRVINISDRLSEVERENVHLRNQLGEANSKIADTEHKLEGVTRDFDNERAVTVRLQETIVSRDSKVTELEVNLNTERDAHRVTLRERDEARNEVGDLRALVQSLREQLATLNSERDHLRAENEGYQRTISEQQTRLDRIMSVLQPVSRDVAAS